ncbi:MAG: tetratricopeptide repeat protein [Flavobacteriales bacterium]
MKEFKPRKLAFILLAVLPFTGCKLLDPLPEYEVEPKPLRVKGDSVRVKIKVDFKPESFHKKATATATPVLKYEGGKTEFESVTFQGEKVTKNHETIPHDKGKSYTYTDKVAYNEDMKRSVLNVKLKGSKGNKTETFDEDSLALGVITTPHLLMNDDKVLLGKDNFQRTTKHTKRSVIHYRINSPRVRNKELRDDDIKKMEKFLGKVKKSEDLQMENLELVAYASPDGELTLNEDLAKNRAKSGMEYFKEALSEKEIDSVKDGFYNKKPQGEDWKGFKKKMEASDIKDKKLILRVLSQYGDTKKREKEIKNMAETYKVIADKILPELRRTQLILHYKKIGKTDKELKELAMSNPDSLKLEELMKAGSLFESPDKKLKVYKQVEQQYPDDWRGPNNVGKILMMKNKPKEARKKFKKAAEIKETAIVKNNLGVAARLKGDLKKAAKKFKNAQTAGPEVSYNLALVNIQNGDYDAASSNIGDEKSFNKALLQVVKGNPDAAVNTLDKAPEATSAKGLYLKAIIGARKGNKDMVMKNLKKAVQKNASLKKKAKKDAEFHKYWGSSDFSSIVG